MSDSVNTPLMQVKGLKKYFSIKSNRLFERPKNLYAVDDVSFDVFKLETLGVVGESGSGKSTLARAILGLVPKTGGQIMYDGVDITDPKGSKSPGFVKRRELQMVFQDPFASLNPRIKIGSAIEEAIMACGKSDTRAEAKKRAKQLLEMVGLSGEMANRYPHEFSGGQRQRVGIARALAAEPHILFCDESVSALDVSVQAQVLNLFNQLKKELDLTYVFIAHDLAVIKYVSDRIAVMYLGKIMEIATTEDLFERNLHPYTKALISAIPEPSTTPTSERIILKGDIPSPINPPKGCRFYTRCFMAAPECEKEEPLLRELYPGHYVSCHCV